MASNSPKGFHAFNFVYEFVYTYKVLPLWRGYLIFLGREFPYNSVSLIEAEGHLCLFCIICGVAARQNEEAGTEQVLQLRMKSES